jgi:hypothetical protein
MDRTDTDVVRASFSGFEAGVMACVNQIEMAADKLLTSEQGSSALMADLLRALAREMRESLSGVSGDDTAAKEPKP